MGLDFGTILNKMKENLFLIPEEKFDKLSDSKDYTEVVVYLAIAMFVNMLLVSLIAGTFNIINLIIGVVLGVVMAFIVFGIFFLLLKLVGGKATYQKTFNTFVYGSTCNYLFGWIPLLGLVAGLISLANVVLGQKRVHGIELWKAILVLVVLPVLVAGLILILFAATFASVLGANPAFTSQFQPVY